MLLSDNRENSINWSNALKVVSSAGKNEEVGVAVSNEKVVFKEDDIVETYREVKVKKEISWNPPGF